MFAGEVGAAFGVEAAFRDGEAVQGAVELAVAASVEAVALGVARGRFDRRGPGDACELGVGREAADPGDLADEFGGCEDAAAGLGEQSGRDRSEEGGELALELVDSACELADAAQLVSGDPHASRLLAASKPAGYALLPVSGGQRSGWDLKLGPRVVEVPAQVVDQACARGDRALAVVDEQANIELRPGELGDRKRLQSLADRPTGDRDRVDRVGLAPLTH